MNTIDAKDLLVGSYVYCSLPQPSTVARVTKIDGAYAGLVLEEVGKQYNDWISYLKPIPITPGWLEKLGFLEENGRYEYWAEDQAGDPVLICSINWQQTSVFFKFTDSDDRTVEVAIKSIHHLQATVWHLERIWLSIEQKEVVG